MSDFPLEELLISSYKNLSKYTLESSAKKNSFGAERGLVDHCNKKRI